jgi:uncharacterized phiE125 gp8 family phage protein
MIATIVTAPVKTPVTIEELKRQLRLETEPGEWDVMLDMYISATVNTFEQLTGRSLMLRTMALKGKPDSNDVALKGWPVVAVASVTYYDAQNVAQTLAVADYELDTTVIPALLKIKTMPVMYDRSDAMTITYSAGYASAKDVPADIRAAILVGAASKYEQPVDSIQSLPSVFYNIVNNNKLWTR